MPISKRHPKRRKMIEWRKKHPVEASPIDLANALDWLFKQRNQEQNK